MGTDLGLFLSIFYGAATDGDTLSFSIRQGENSILGILPQSGLTGSHNNCEEDVSPTRGDLHEYVNDDINLLTNFHALRLQHSVESNPYLFNAVISGVAIAPATYPFIFRFKANKSEEYPEGRLDGKVGWDGVEVVFRYHGPGGQLNLHNWFKRAIGDEEGLEPLILDINTIALAHPQFLAIGGNTGQVNTFTGVDVEVLTGGVYHAATLLEGNNFQCFLLQAAMMAITAVGGLPECL